MADVQAHCVEKVGDTQQYYSKQFHGEAQGMLQLWWKQITPPEPSLPGQIWPRVAANESILSLGQIERFRI